MNTCIPGKILSFNGATASVKPAMPMTLANGETLDAPSIVSVPVCFPVGMGGAAQVTVPLRAGDDCLLFFSQRSIDNWLSGNDQAPDDPRQNDLSDAFCCPLMRPGVGVVDTEAVTMQYGGASIKIDSGGTITITGNVVIEGGALTHNGTNVGSSHRHSGITPGSSNTGGPL